MESLDNVHEQMGQFYQRYRNDIKGINGNIRNILMTDYLQYYKFVMRAVTKGYISDAKVWKWKKISVLGMIFIINTFINSV